ncbi:hypothetical protein VNO80_25573 [Phaseolus coccineus]|uniref:Uncharacterized protein n=1 Tax=Phaseolus coccineus TaxID=3886 RepID=A0AAN9QP48_PHACN
MPTSNLQPIMHIGRGIINFHDDLFLRQRPLDLVHNVHVHDDCVVSPTKVDDGKVIACKLNAVFLIDEVEDHSSDAEEDLLGDLKRHEGGDNNIGILEEEGIGFCVAIVRTTFFSKWEQFSLRVLEAIYGGWMLLRFHEVYSRAGVGKRRIHASLGQ